MTKVAIVGCSQSKSLAPFDDESFEIWGVNNLYPHIPRASRWFEIHEITQQGETYLRRGDTKFRGQPVNDYLKQMGEWTKEKNCPVYMQKHWDLVPTSIPYPVEEMIQKFGGYFTNSVSWMIALAIHEGATEIHVYGVDMAVDCLAPETKVLTDDLRWVRSDEIKVGDKLIGFDEFRKEGNASRRWRTSTVTKAVETVKPCYAMHMEDGQVIIASEKHGWLTHGENMNRWKTTDELCTKHHRGDRHTKIMKLTDVWDQPNTWDAGYLAAAFDGEGHFSNAQRNGLSDGIYTTTLAFAQNQNQMLDHVVKALQSHGFDFAVYKKLKVVNGPGDDCHTVNIKGGKREVMRFLGQMRPHRLGAKFDPEKLGEIQAKENVSVLKTEFIGNQKVIGLETDTKTFIAEGYASHNSEYHHQRPSCEYFLGVAVGLGIKIHVPPEADLLKTRFLYGFQEPQKTAWDKKIKMMNQTIKEKKTRIEGEITEFKKQIQIREAQMHQYVGAEHALKESDKIWS